MHNLLRYYRQNKRKVIYTVLFIIFIFLIIQNAGKLFYTNTNSNENYVRNENNQIKDYSSESKSIISGGKVKEEYKNTYGNLIDTFLKYCSDSKIEEAYKLISEECKKEQFPNVNEFRKNYINIKFSGNKTCSFQSWSKLSNIYYIKIFENSLSTGQVNTEYGEDYIRVIEENNQNKLNINSFIGRRDIKSNTEQNGLKISINYSKMYKDYEIYNITITNYTKKTILLDSRRDDESIYLLNKKDVKLNSWIHENNEEDLIVQAGETKDINIKFGFVYNENQELRQMSFSNIVLDYQNYITNNDYNEFTEINLQL